MKPDRFFPLLVTMLAACCTLFSCRNKSDIPIEEVLLADSITVDTTHNDSLTEEKIENPPKQADELFDDFVFAFMKNAHFQKSRTNFPLPYTVDGNRRTIASTAWKFDKMFSKDEVYTLIFNNAKEEAIAKDTTLRQVTVEETDFDTHRTKSYYFKRIEGEWRLTAMGEQDYSNSKNSDFYLFYQRFATDDDFQYAHIEDPLPFSTYDDDIFEVVDGVIAATQFKDFAPELPKKKITNILYGQAFHNPNFRTLSIRALSSGMESNIQFRKNAEGEWMLTRLEN